MKPLSVIEECQRLGALIINVSKFDHMKSDELPVTSMKASANGCQKCGGRVLYSDYSFSFKCIKCGEGL